MGCNKEFDQWARKTSRLSQIAKRALEFVYLSYDDFRHSGSHRNSPYAYGIMIPRYRGVDKPCLSRYIYHYETSQGNDHPSIR